MFRRKNGKPDSVETDPPASEPRMSNDDLPLPPLKRSAPPPDYDMKGPGGMPLRRLGETPNPAAQAGVTAMPGLGNAGASAAATPTPPAPQRRVAVPLGRAEGSNEGKRLIVGRDICLQGEITSCDVLVVEGRVEASISARDIEIAESGVFKGNAEIEHAEIAGRYEGNLTVRDRLHIRATGKLIGTVRYRRLEIELGGEIVGDLKTLEGGASVVSYDEAKVG